MNHAFKKHDYQCGICRKKGHWEGTIPVNQQPPGCPTEWTTLPKVLVGKATGILAVISIPICSEECAAEFKTKSSTIPEVLGIARALAEVK